MYLSSLIFFSIFAFIAILNFYVWIANRHFQKNYDYISLIGAILFTLAIISSDKPYSLKIYFWLLADIGTVILISHLPYFIRQILIENRFTCYALYQNTEQKLILYRCRTSQTFIWEYTAEISEQLPILISFSGTWTISGNQLHLMIENDCIASAQLEDKQLLFTKIEKPHYSFLADIRLNKN